MLSFYEASQKIEAQLADIERLRGNAPYISSRKQGKLFPSDPINRFAASVPTIKDLNIVWITGMWSGMIPGTGNYAELLKPLGYNINVIKTKAGPFTAGLGRVSREVGWAPKRLQRMGQSHIAKNAERYQQAVGEGQPDIIIGSSQGGAVALQIAPENKDVPMLLLAPAWKIFHTTPTYLNPNSIIVHGFYDKEVPIRDSEILAKRFNVRLIVTEDGHIITRGFWQVVRALSEISRKVLAQKTQGNYHES